MALVEGNHRLFVGNDEVPNLLRFEDSEGMTEYLLPHRVLTLLNFSGGSTSSKTLLSSMRVLGYTRRDVINCLAMLAKSHLIGASDAEVIDDALLPTECYLTSAGSYYLTHLFPSPEYLLSAVMDVSLEHREVRRKGVESVPARLHSLMEYLEQIKRAEDFQVSQMKRSDATPALRKVAAALASGGLLVSNVLHAIESLNGANSDPRSPGVGVDFHAQIKTYTNWRDGAEQRCHEAENRGRAKRAEARQSIQSIDAGTEVNVELQPAGDDLAIATQVSTQEQLEAAFVSVSSPPDTETRFSRATVIAPQEADSQTGLRLEGHFRQVTAASLPDGVAADLDVQIVKIPNSGRGLGLLSINQVGELLEIEFHHLTRNAITSERTGREVRLATLERWAAEELTVIAGLVTANVPFVDRLRAFGVELMRKVLTEAGQNYIASLYKLVDTLVIFSNQHGVPWEWLCPAPTRDSRLPPISDEWRIVRWPSSLIRGILSLALAEQDAPGYPLQTLGLEPTEPWRLPAPTRASDLEAGAESGATLHLVGHWSGAGLRFEGGFTLDSLLAKGLRLRKARNVVISSCDAAVIETQGNLAIAISTTSECVVWAPLVPLRSDQVDILDRALASFLNEDRHRTVDQFMRQCREVLPILNVYVRYGLNMWR